MCFSRSLVSFFLSFFLYSFSYSRCGQSILVSFILSCKQTFYLLDKTRRGRIRPTTALTPLHLPAQHTQQTTQQTTPSLLAYSDKKRRRQLKEQDMNLQLILHQRDRLYTVEVLTGDLIWTREMGEDPSLRGKSGHSLSQSLTTRLCLGKR